MLVAIAVVLIVSLLSQWQKKVFDDRIEMVSDLDGTKYLVRNTVKAKQTADALARLKGKIQAFVGTLLSTETGAFRPMVQRLSARMKNSNIAEGVIDNRYTSYTVNKGTDVVMCMRSRDPSDELYDDNILFGVALHELGHVGSISEGHETEFQRNFGFLLDAAIRMGLYKRIDRPFNYCGLRVKGL